MPQPASRKSPPPLARLLQTAWQPLRRSLPPLPTRCWLCDGWPCASPICAACQHLHHPSSGPQADTLPRCLHCAMRLPHAGSLICGTCLNTPPPLLRCWASVDYAPPWRGLIAQWKFKQEPALAHSLAQLMLGWQGSAVLHSYAALGLRPILLPIPPEPSRLQQRGHHHSLLLAQSLARAHGWAVMPHALLRLPQPQGQAAQQAKRRRAERFKAMRRAFMLHPQHAAALQGQHLLLIDDVMTTGATLYSAAQALQAAGVASVSAWVFARTGR